MKTFFRKICSLSLAASLLLTLIPHAFASEALGDDLTMRETPLAQSTTLAEGTFWSNTYSDLRQENYIVYTPNSAVKPIVTYGGSVTAKTTVPAAAKALEEQGYRIIAGINGDYFGTTNGAPLGSVMTEGVLRNALCENYAIGFRADGSAILGKPDLALHVSAERGEFDLTAINHIRYSYGGIYLYTADFNARHSTGTNQAGYDLVCSALSGRLSIGETLTLKVEQVLPEAVDTAIDEGQYVLTTNLLAADGSIDTLSAFSVGDTLTISVTAAQDGWNDVDYMVGALYQLVENGGVCAGLEAGSAPRTAIGQREDGSIVLYTIDGRRSGYSIGASLTQIAERLVELGCVSALCLDGGGSTTMSVTLPDAMASEVYNIPSDGGARAVTNHIFLVAPAAPSGVLDHIYLSAEYPTALARACVALRAAAIDTNGIPMDTAVDMASDRGSVSDAVLTTPAEVGIVTVGAKAGGKYTTAEVSVVTSPDEIVLLRDGKRVDSLTLFPGDSLALEAQAICNHVRIAAQNECFTWSIEGSIGTVDEHGVFIAAGRVGNGTLVVGAGETELRVPITLSAAPLVLLSDFESDCTPFAQNTTSAYVRYGHASAKLDYQLANDDLSEVLPAQTFALSYSIPSGYDRVTFWVYGDGSNALLSLETDQGSVPAVLLQFSGWQQISIPLSAGTTAVTGLTLSSAAPISGTLYLDQFVAAYGTLKDDEAPELTLAYAEDGSIQCVAFDAVDGSSLKRTLTYDRVALPYSVDALTGALIFTLPESDSAYHRLTLTASDASGNLARATLAIAPAEGSTPDNFSDTTEHWAAEAVSYLKSTGLSNGSGDGQQYKPNSNISRQEFATLLYRYLTPAQDYSAVELPFADTDSIASWATDSVKALYALGIVGGSQNLKGELCFHPTATISRAEAVTMLGRLLKQGYEAPDLNFTDNSSIPAWASTHVATLVGMGVIAGNPDGSFAPSAPMTRAQVATVLYKLS